MGCFYSNGSRLHINLASNSASNINLPKSQEFRCNGRDYYDCSHINRLRDILTYYSEWIANHNDKDDADKEIGIYQYIRKGGKYSLRRLLNDYHHLINDHLNNTTMEFENIYNYFCEALSTKKCMMTACNMMTRNNRDRNTSNTSNISNTYFLMEHEEELITQQILDQIHCFIFHTFDVGFKLTMKEKLELQLEIDDNKNNNNENIKNNGINHRDPRKECIGRLIRRKKDKVGGLRNKNKFMSDCHISQDNILIDIADEEERKDDNGNEADTDSPIQNDKDAMFSFGVRYYYDADKYKNNSELDIEFNIGEKYMNWFINMKYKTLKNELLNNKTCRIEAAQFHALYLKCQQYMKTHRILQNCRNIVVENLIGIMIYCNFDMLQAEYTKTYRYLSEHESAYVLKQRHLEFAQLGRALQEAVELNGIRVEKGNTKTFYHGINAPLLFTSSLCRFNGPISTSSAYEVAATFANRHGIILELNDGTLLSNESDAIYFDCEWISDFAYEKEKFFIGGRMPLKIVGIFHVKLNENYKVYVNLINILLSILKGDIAISEELNDKNGRAIIKLLQHELKESTIAGMPVYIDKLIHHICANIKFIANKYDVTFATNRYNVLAQFFMCKAQFCQFFKLGPLTDLFPNLTSIAVERNVLTSYIFENIYTYLEQQENKDESEKKLLNNIIFKSPISGHKNSMSFDKIIKRYNKSYEAYKWSISISQRNKDWLVIKSNDDNSKHQRYASTNLLKSQKTFDATEQFALYTFFVENM